ncbi:MAG: hypothetical protein ACTSPI_11110 [Candidatus Heimdallarchaeaceae archaeon]
MVKIRDLISIKGLILIITIFIFILVNSSQEQYIPLDQISQTTLETIQTIQTDTTTTQETTTTNTDSEFYSSYPQDYTQKTFFFPQFLIPLLFGILIVGFIIFLLSKKKKFTSIYIGTSIAPIVSATKGRREIFRTQIITLQQVLKQYLEKTDYTQGIIYGYQKMDENMKRLLGMKRDSFLTPKEFADSLELPDILPHLKEIVNLFYLARYKIEKMRKEDLESFISNLEAIQSKSKVGKPIEVVRKVVKEEET